MERRVIRARDTITARIWKGEPIVGNGKREGVPSLR